MKPHLPTTIFGAEQSSRWRRQQAGIWARDDVDMETAPAQSILTTLFDQPRWLEVHHLYDQRGSELFEAICELPEYYLTRTENAILEASASQIIEAAPVKCIVELGAGYSKKTVHLLTEQVSRRGPSIFAPIDVSISGLLASREAVQRDFPDLQFQGLHAHYEDGFTAVDKNLPTLFVFLGSSIGNFNNTEFARFFRALTSAMGPNDYLLLGVDRLKPVEILERRLQRQPGRHRGIHSKRLSQQQSLAQKQFRLESGPLPFLVQSRMATHRNVRPAMEDQEIFFPTADTGFRWEQDEQILVEISRKFEPARLQEQLRFFGLRPVAHFTDAQEWFSVLLFKKS